MTQKPSGVIMQFSESLLRGPIGNGLVDYEDKCRRLREPAPVHMKDPFCCYNLHELIYQIHRNYGSLVSKRSCSAGLALMDAKDS